MSLSVSKSLEPSGKLGKESIKYRRTDFNGTPKYNSPVRASGYSSNNVELYLVVSVIANRSRSKWSYIPERFIPIFE